jgi:AcrR family transcriptional regulator
VDDSENKKERIFLATLRLISENGFHGTPVSLIAQAAGVGAGANYRYFEKNFKSIFLDQDARSRS